MKRVLNIMVLSFCMIFILAISAFAYEVEENNVKVNDIIEGDNGAEIVITILEDGRFVTAPLTLELRAACAHTNIMGTGSKHKVSSSYNKSDSTYCYKYRYYEDARCANCGKSGFKIYDKSWTKVKHKYKLLGDTCTVCDYKK